MVVQTGWIPVLSGARVLAALVAKWTKMTNTLQTYLGNKSIHFVLILRLMKLIEIEYI
jgi:hypothetical protein